jgi:Na+-transporting methylmalonyl-CoA/oxaloacetate decarboxylase beta subunit
MISYQYDYIVALPYMPIIETKMPEPGPGTLKMLGNMFRESGLMQKLDKGRASKLAGLVSRTVGKYGEVSGAIRDFMGGEDEAD